MVLSLINHAMCSFPTHALPISAAKSNFPMARGITIEAVRKWVRECPICQKHRDTGIRGLPEEILTLKVKGWRSVIGVDMISVQKD